MMGLTGTGKSSLTLMFMDEKFNNDHDLTIESAFSKYVEVEEKVYNLNILDTSGQEEYENLQEIWIKQCQGFILIYDISSESSLLGLTDIIEKIKRKYYDIEKGDSSCPMFPCVIVGNKSDLVKERTIPSEMGKKFASDSLIESLPNESFQKGIMPYFVETSAKKNVNIEIPFRSIIYQMIHYNETICGTKSNVTKEKKKKSIFSSVSQDDDVEPIQFKTKK